MTTFTPLKVTFELDGTGVVYDPFEPPMLDALIAWVVGPFVGKDSYLGRDDKPEDLTLPLARWHKGDVWGYRASALFPVGDTIVESGLFYRGRMRLGMLERCAKGSPNTTMGCWRSSQTKAPLTLCRELVGWCVGDRAKVKNALRRVRFIGKKRSYGRGLVTGLRIEHTDEDYSLTRGGLAMRYLPDPNGLRLVRMRAPYWNNVDRVPSCEILDAIEWSET